MAAIRSVPYIIGLLKDCATRKDIYKGSKIHAEILKTGLLEKNCRVGNTLINMYAKCGALQKARKVLLELPLLDVVSWSALIAGYVQEGHCEEALECFRQMQCEGHSPDAVTFSSALKACGQLGAADKGERIHDEIVRRGLLGKDAVLGSSLVDMYAKCGVLSRARQALDKLPDRDVVAWTALISGYTQQGQAEEALKCFDQMQQEGHSPNAITFTCTLKACGSIRASEKGEEIHTLVVRYGWLKKDAWLGVALVDMYVKCCELQKAQQALNELPVCNVAVWSALIVGYVEQDQAEEALCFDRMQNEGLCPDAVAFLCILKACATVGSTEKGKHIHDEISRQGLLENNIKLGTALVDMYAKCGALAKAQCALIKLPMRNVMTWNALITGYARQARNRDVLSCFKEMQREGILPDETTMVCVLNACSQSGLLHEAQTYFASMSSKYGIAPDVQHYACMVNLFGRAGEFEKALAFIKEMPVCDYLPVWHALVCACQKWGNVELGRFVFERAVQAGKADAALYICMTNMYTAAGMEEEAEKIDAMRVRDKLEWKPSPEYGRHK